MLNCFFAESDDSFLRVMRLVSMCGVGRYNYFQDLKNPENSMFSVLSPWYHLTAAYAYLRFLPAHILSQYSGFQALELYRFLNVWIVISGGQLKRTSTDDVPAPREV